jgi:hypothetical protein
MDSIRKPLLNAQQAAVAFASAQEAAKPYLIAGHRLVLTVKPATRTDEMNARLHATIGEIAKQLEWAGKKRDTETWKRLLVAAWLRARGDSLEILPAIDGRGVDIVFQRTSKLTQRETGELCEYVYAFGAENGVRFTAVEYAE